MWSLAKHLIGHPEAVDAFIPPKMPFSSFPERSVHDGMSKISPVEPSGTPLHAATMDSWPNRCRDVQVKDSRSHSAGMFPVGLGIWNLATRPGSGRGQAAMTAATANDNAHASKSARNRSPRSDDREPDDDVDRFIAILCVSSCRWGRSSKEYHSDRSPWVGGTRVHRERNGIGQADVMLISKPTEPSRIPGTKQVLASRSRRPRTVLVLVADASGSVGKCPQEQRRSHPREPYRRSGRPRSA